MNFQARPGRCRFWGLLAGKTTSLVLPCLLFFQASGPASAGDWSVNLNTDNRATVYDNFFLERNPRGALVEYTGITDLNALYKMHDGQLDFTGQLTDHQYQGRHHRDVKSGLFPHLGAHWRKQNTANVFDISGFYEYESINPGDVYDSGNGLDGGGLDGSGGNGANIGGGGNTGAQSGGDLANRYTRRHRGNIYASLDHRFNVRNSLKWSNRYSRTIYDGYGSNNEGMGSGLDYGYRLTKRTTVNFIGDVNWLKNHNKQRTLRLDYSLKTRLNSEITENLKFYTTVGTSLLDTHDDWEDRRRRRTRFHGTGDLGFRYKIKTTEIGMDAGYGTFENGDGNLEQRFRAAVDYTWNISHAQAFNLNARFDYWKASKDSTTGDSHILAIAPNYSVALARDWKGALGYRFEMRNHHSHTYFGNNVWVSLSRNFILHP